MKEHPMSQHQGQCHCGAIRYLLKMKPMRVVNCHCNFCRSHTGAPFSTFAAVAQTRFEIEMGEEHLSRYKVGERGIKHFCSQCGTPLFNQNHKFPGLNMVYLGTLANAHNFTPAINVWCDSKLDWVDGVGTIESKGQGVERS